MSTNLLNVTLEAEEVKEVISKITSNYNGGLLFGCGTMVTMFGVNDSKNKFAHAIQNAIKNTDCVNTLFAYCIAYAIICKKIIKFSNFEILTSIKQTLRKYNKPSISDLAKQTTVSNITVSLSADYEPSVDFTPKKPAQSMTSPMYSQLSQQNNVDTSKSVNKQFKPVQQPQQPQQKLVQQPQQPQQNISLDEYLDKNPSIADSCRSIAEEAMNKIVLLSEKYVAIAKNCTNDKLVIKQFKTDLDNTLLDYKQAYFKVLDLNNAPESVLTDLDNAFKKLSMICLNQLNIAMDENRYNGLDKFYEFTISDVSKFSDSQIQSLINLINNKKFIDFCKGNNALMDTTNRPFLTEVEMEKYQMAEDDKFTNKFFQTLPNGANLIVRISLNKPAGNNKADYTII